MSSQHIIVTLRRKKRAWEVGVVISGDLDTTPGIYDDESPFSLVYNPLLLVSIMMNPPFAGINNDESPFSLVSIMMNPPFPWYL